MTMTATESTRVSRDPAWSRWVTASRDAGTWANRLRSHGFSVNLAPTTKTGEGLPLGVADEALSRARAARAAVISGPPGSDRQVVARALQREWGVADSVCFDGVEKGVDEAVVACLAELGRGAASGGGTMIFCDHADELTPGTRNQLLAAEGVRVVLGVTRSGDAPLLDARGAVTLEVVPLDERRGEIAPLVRAWSSSRKRAPELTQASLEALQSRPWPGDVAELRATLESLTETGGDGGAVAEPGADLKELSLADLEREHIYRVLDAHGWNRTRSAKVLGIDVKTLYNKLKRYESSDARKRD